MPLMKMKVHTHSFPDRRSLSREARQLPIGAVLDLSPEDAERALAQGTAEEFDEKEGCSECKKQPRGCCSIECFRGMHGEDVTHAEYFDEMLKREGDLREKARAARQAPEGDEKKDGEHKPEG